MLVAILAGASEYVSQSAESPELERVIGMVNNGGGYFDWETARRVIGRIQDAKVRGPTESIPDVLSDREVMYADLIGPPEIRLNSHLLMLFGQEQFISLMSHRCGANCYRKRGMRT